MRTIIVIDEAHHYLRDKRRNRVLQKLIREIRSKGASVFLLSQSPDDYNQDEFDFTELLEFVFVLEQWDQIREERSQDLLIYLALTRFGRRPRFSQLPIDLRLDVRAFFSTYRRACKLADDLLFSAGKPDTVNEACIKSPVGSPDKFARGTPDLF